MFKEMMEQIDMRTHEISTSFSIILEDMLVDDYDEMYEEQPEAMELLASNVPYICATAEPGMKPAEIEAFKSQLEKEYQRAKQAMR